MFLCGFFFVFIAEKSRLCTLLLLDGTGKRGKERGRESCCCCEPRNVGFSPTRRVLFIRKVTFLNNILFNFSVIDHISLFLFIVLNWTKKKIILTSCYLFSFFSILIYFSSLYSFCFFLFIFLVLWTIRHSKSCIKIAFQPTSWSCVMEMHHFAGVSDADFFFFFSIFTISPYFNTRLCIYFLNWIIFLLSKTL